MSPGITLSRASAIGGLLLCVLLAPIVPHAAALPDGDEADWIARLLPSVLGAPPDCDRRFRAAPSPAKLDNACRVYESQPR